MIEPILALGGLTTLYIIGKDDKIKGDEKAEIAFALGKASEDVKDFKNASKYFNEGNLFRRKNLVFSIEKEKEEFSKIKNIFNKNIFEKHTQFRNLDPKAIFIVGMPRSGTTLVEQILSSHPNVFGGDELNYLPYLIKKNFPNLNDIINVNDKTLNEISKLSMLFKKIFVKNILYFVKFFFFFFN